MNSEKYSAKLETVKKNVTPEIEKVIGDAVNTAIDTYKTELFAQLCRESINYKSIFAKD